MVDSYICMGARRSGAGSEKDPSAAARGLVAFGRLGGKEDHAGQEIACGGGLGRPRKAEKSVLDTPVVSKYAR
jgi:hypothetical protein